MSGQPGLFDADARPRELSAAGDPLERLRGVVDFELFRLELEAALERADRSRGGRPLYDAVLTFRILVLQTLYTLSDDQTEYQLRDRLLHDRGYLAMGGQIVDATVIEARRLRLSKDEKQTLRDDGTPSGWSKAPARQIDRDGRWTIKRGKKAPPREGAQRQAVSEIAVPLFGYKNHIGIDHGHGFIRRFTVTHAARHDGGQLSAVLDPANTASEVWADTAYRSKANLALLDRRGLVAQFQRAKPRGQPVPAHIARGNAARARVRSRVEHVFAAEKHRMGLLVRSIGLLRATAKITLANLAYNMQRLVWIGGRTVPA